MSFFKPAAIAAFAFCVLVSASAHAGLRTVERGEKITLGPDEGLLLAAIDSDFGVEYLEVRGTGLGGEKVHGIDAGRTVVLMAGTAGTYRYGKLQSGSTMGNLMSGRYYFDLSSDARYRCKVEPGTINYCGDIRARSAGGGRALFGLRNYGASAIEHVDAAFPGLRAKYPFRYRGRHADAWPEWLESLEREAKPAPALADLPAAGKTDALPAEKMFQAERVKGMSINPSGSLLLERGYLGTNHLVSIIDVASGRSVDVHRGPQEPLTAQWAGERTVVLEFEGGGALRNIVLVKLTHVPGSVPVASAMGIPVSGLVVDPLPADENHILMARYDVDRGYGLYRIDVSRSKVATTQFDHNTRVGDHVDSPVRWLTDARGAVQAMVTSESTGVEQVFVRRDDRFERVTTLGPDETFYPVAIDRESGALLVVTDRDRGFAELCAFDPASGKLTTLLGVEGADVVSVAMTSSRKAIGVHYYMDGRPRVKYLDRERSRTQSALEKAFPGSHVVPVDRTRDERLTVVLVDGPTTPPAYYLHDRDKRSIELLGQAYPWLDGQRYVAPKRIVAKAPDGLEVEAFLYAPPGVEAAPLVAMPHGGPIGIFDAQHFDSEVQFLATRGYAVLQVNYRGSGGRGRAVRDAGLRAAGRKIEEDVIAAIDAAIAAGGIDPQRVCIGGASYGGYSALRAAMRWPDRFRCAISMFGATDLGLQFTASDAADDAGMIDWRSRWIGDPVKDAAELRSLSPLYAPQPLAVPILLVHGTEDDRVPYEHSVRLKRAMELRGRPVRLVTLEGEGHGIRTLDAQSEAWNTIVRFLAQHLAPATN